MFTEYRPGHTCSALKRSRRTRRSPSFLGTTNSNLSAVSALPTYPLARSLTQSLIRLSRKLFGNISRQASPASLLPSSSSPIAFITDDNWGDATEQTFSAASQHRWRSDGGVSVREAGRQATSSLNILGQSGVPWVYHAPARSLRPPGTKASRAAANDAPIYRIFLLFSPPSQPQRQSAGKYLRCSLARSLTRGN